MNLQTPTKSTIPALTGRQGILAIKYMWKKNLGSSLKALGMSLQGIGIVPQLAGAPSKLLSGIAIAGFACNAAGIFFDHLFAQDQQTQITNQTKTP